MKQILVIVGPTAVGKTELSLSLAERLNGEIVSADSVQVYKGMDIGSAKASLKEQRRVRHHMLDIFPPEYQDFSVAVFRQLAGKAIDDILTRGKLPIIVGGSGLYINSLTRPLTFSTVPADAVLRAQIEAEYDADRTAVYDELTHLDPVAAANIHINNKKRVMRALEICRVTGRPMSESGGDFHNEAGLPNEYDPIIIGLDCDRAELNLRIDRRVDMMIEQGLLDEVMKLTHIDRRLPSVQALGYKQLLKYIDGMCTLDTAIDDIKRETRRFAKRQMTWFKRDDRILWMKVTEYSDADTLLNAAEGLVNERL